LAGAILYPRASLAMAFNRSPNQQSLEKATVLLLLKTEYDLVIPSSLRSKLIEAYQVKPLFNFIRYAIRQNNSALDESMTDLIVLFQIQTQFQVSLSKDVQNRDLSRVVGVPKGRRSY
jgi:hypothetical protein